MTNVPSIDRLATLGRYHIMDTPAEPHFDAIVREASDAAAAPIAMISLIDERRQWFKAKVGVDHHENPIEHSICAHAIESDDVFVVGDAQADDRFSAFPAVAKENGIRFYAGAPLRMRDGARLGTLCVIDVEPRAELGPAERNALQALARRTVAAFELRRDIRDRAAEQATDPQYEPGDHVWLDQASRLLAQASAALDHVGATGASAHLEQVIAMVDELRIAVGQAGPDNDAGELEAVAVAAE